MGRRSKGEGGEAARRGRAVEVRGVRCSSKNDEGATDLNGDNEDQVEGEFDGTEMLPVEEQEARKVEEDVHLDAEGESVQKNERDLKFLLAQLLRCELLDRSFCLTGRIMTHE